MTTIAPPDAWRLTPEQPPVVIAIAHWNRLELLRRCLARLREHTDYPHYRICVFDQGSHDGSVEYLQRVEPDIDVVYSPENIGFAPATNAIVERYPAWDVVLLNNDTEVTGGWLSALVSAARADAVGLVGARLVSSSGVLQEAGGEVFADGRVRARGRGESAGDPRFGERRVVDYCSAACLFVKRSVFDRCGAFDPVYEAGYYEDVDLAFRARAAGFTVLYEPHCVVIHHEHSSYGAVAANTLMRRHRDTFRSRWAAQLSPLRHSPFELEVTGRPRLLLATDLVPGHTLSPRMRRIRQLIRELSGTFQIAYLNSTAHGLARYAAVIDELGATPFYVPVDAAPGSTGLDEEELLRVNYFPVAICGNADAARYLRNRFPAAMLDATTVVVDVGMEADAAGAAARTGASRFVATSERQREQVLAALPHARCAVLPLSAESPASRCLPREARTDVVMLSDNVDGPAAAEALERVLTNMTAALRAHLPGARLVLGAGSLPSGLLANASRDLSILPSAAPLGPVLDRARVVAVPQHWCGPDTISNIAEARARAIPLVSSSTVLQAAGLTAPLHALAAETPAAFVEQIVRAYTDPWCWNALASASATAPARASADGLAHALAAWSAGEAMPTAAIASTS